MGLIDHLKHRLNPKTIATEVADHFTDKVIPHGADEVGNVLFSGSAYLPWPGQGGPEPLAAPAVEPAAPEPNKFDTHAAMYGVSYTDMLDQAAKRGGLDDDRGRSR